MDNPRVITASAGLTQELRLAVSRLPVQAGLDRCGGHPGRQTARDRWLITAVHLKELQHAGPLTQTKEGHSLI